MMKKKHSHVPVHWMEDGPAPGLNAFGTIVSVLPTFELTGAGGTGVAFVTDMNQLPADPAGLVGTLGAASTAAIDRSPQAQLATAKRGLWRLMRCVGDFTCAIKQQVAAGTAGATTAAPFVEVTLGLCLLDLDDDGTPLNLDDWHLGATVLPEDDESVSLRTRGMANSWIFRRSWLLQNFAAGAIASNTMTMGDGVGVSAVLTTYQLAQYSLGYSSTKEWASQDLGAHFDIKRHVTVGPSQRLAWMLHAIDADMPGTHDTGFNLRFNMMTRKLIAKPGRPFKEKR